MYHVNIGVNVESLQRNKSVQCTVCVQVTSNRKVERDKARMGVAGLKEKTERTGVICRGVKRRSEPLQQIFLHSPAEFNPADLETANSRLCEYRQVGTGDSVQPWTAA